MIFSTSESTLIRTTPADLPHSWPELDEQPTDDTILRHEQIKLRVAEIEAVIDTMNKLSQGGPLADCQIDAPNFEWERWKFVDTTRPVMAGHSLGGSAAVSGPALFMLEYHLHFGLP